MFDLKEIFSVKFLLGLVINLMVVAWLVSARVTTVEADIARLKETHTTIVSDHETLIELKADLKYLRQAVDDIRAKLK